MANHHYDEQRNFVRMRVETQVTYTVKGSEGLTHHGISNDLSATGLYMITDFAPAVGDVINIIMNPSGDRLPPFVAEGNVVRIKVDEKNADKFHVSVELTQTS